MNRTPQIAILPDGKRLHLQDGPIDLVIEARGRDGEVRAAYEAAAQIHWDGLQFRKDIGHRAISR